ncbi:hypothetical protein EH223_01570 [candidate division KSB1 bacterium]|nr:glycoside hydrolase family protein [candidate division KSB1 bacterium]RQW06887.1 MAG: hypothetical protein EH223_01570 [candidate division KSB1 bacterium]
MRPHIEITYKVRHARATSFLVRAFFQHIILTLLCLTFFACSSRTPAPILDRLQPVPRDAGFRMRGYFVWGGSLIKVDNQYHLFASRWPTWESLGVDAEDRGNVSMLGNYRNHSEIVRAVSDDPLGPYQFVQVVLAGRGENFWDGQMCHNPKIVKIGDKYVLYYIGRSPQQSERKIGFAWAESIAGPWHRIDQHILLTDDANNPAPYVFHDGRVLLNFRDRDLTMFMAEAAHFDGRYQIVAANLVPDVKLEDGTLFYHHNRYNLVVEDNVGGLTGDVRHGAHLVSSDGLCWRRHKDIKVYRHTITWTDGTSTTFDRRERPELLNLDNPPERKFDGEPTHLITGVQLGEESWCIVQVIR